MISFIQNILDQFPPIVFLIAVLLAVAINTGILFFGGIVPGGTLLTFVGAWLGLKHDLSMAGLSIIFATIGVGIGSLVSHYFGFYFIKSLEKIPQLNNIAGKQLNLLNDTASHFKQNLWFAIILAGRFVPYFRTLVPLLARRLNLKIIPYTLMSTIAGLIWSFTIVSLGYFIGSRKLLTPGQMIILAVILLGILLLLLSNKRLRLKLTNLFFT